MLLADNHNARAEDTVAFLEVLRHHLPGPCIVVWDRSNIHDKSQMVQTYLAKHPQIHTERLPAYAPELNPDEQVWTQTKYGRMANYTP
jgi:transposase